MTSWICLRVFCSGGRWFPGERDFRGEERFKRLPAGRLFVFVSFTSIPNPKALLSKTRRNHYCKVFQTDSHDRRGGLRTLFFRCLYAGKPSVVVFRVLLSRTFLSRTSCCTLLSRFSKAPRRVPCLPSPPRVVAYPRRAFETPPYVTFAYIFV